MPGHGMKTVSVELSVLEANIIHLVILCHDSFYYVSAVKTKVSTAYTKSINDEYLSSILIKCILFNDANMHVM